MEFGLEFRTGILDLNFVQRFWIRISYKDLLVNNANIQLNLNEMKPYTQIKKVYKNLRRKLRNEKKVRDTSYKRCSDIMTSYGRWNNLVIALMIICKESLIHKHDRLLRVLWRKTWFLVYKNQFIKGWKSDYKTKIL